MKGFFGIVDFESLGFEKSKNRFLGQFSTDQPFSKFDSPGFFLFSLHENFPIVSLTNFPNLVFAGWSRLDNRKELCDALDLADTVSEAQIILGGFLKWKEDLPKHLIGDFSFAIWDNNQQSLFLAKDHLGVRPLYYLFHEGLFYFSTSIPWIKHAVGKKLPLNEIFISKELKNYPQNIEMTFFEGIHRLKPAHYLFISSPKNYKEVRYWDLKKVDLSFCKKDEDYFQLLREKVFQAIMCRTRNKKIIGTQLSGGLDSSAITVILSRLIDKKNLHSYSFVLDEYTKEFSELKVDEQETQTEIIKYAELIPENHHPVSGFYFKNVFEEIERRNTIMGGLGPNDAFYQDSMFKDASENNGVEVIFSGFPGDEGISESGSLFFADYIKNRNYFKLFQYILEFKREGLARVKKYILAKRVGSFEPDYPKIQEIRSLLNPQVEQRFDLKDESFKFYPDFKGWLKHRICMTDTSLRMESENLYANAYGMEMAYPFADIRLLEVLISLPTRLFRPKPMNRAIFREICKGILPEKIRLQKKYNGAFTLAFYEYLCEKNHQELKAYEVKNHLNLIISEEELLKREPECSYCQKERLNFRKEVDYLIGLNWPPNEEKS